MHISITEKDSIKPTDKQTENWALSINQKDFNRKHYNASVKVKETDSIIYFPFLKDI